MSTQPQRIFKYPLEITDTQAIRTSLMSPVPVLVAEQIQGQESDLCLWLQGYQSETDETWIRIRIFGTGHPIPTDQGLKHIGSVSMRDGFVWHVFLSP